jgi:hypothetical protein
MSIMNRDMVIEHLAERYVAEGTYMSKGNGNCFARRGYDYERTHGFTGAVRKNADAAHSGPRIGSVTSLRQRVSNHSNKRVDQIKKSESARHNSRLDENFR